MPRIICGQCKTIENVEETPPRGQKVLCSKCAASPRRVSEGPKKRKNIPRKSHGTRVMLPITCAECGKLDTLDYVPKGTKLEEILCSGCAQEKFGTDSDWARVDRAKEREAKNKEWPFECSECGKTDYLPFEPYPDREFQCNMCRFEHEVPSHERLAGRKKAAGGVFIRRPKKDDDD